VLGHSLVTEPPSLARQEARFDLHIRTHGRFYTEQYESLDEAVMAALALEGEPRERAESISQGGQQLLNRAQLEQRFSALRAEDP
jgi:hypothetical protein